LNGFESTGNARNGILLLSSGSGKDMPDFRSYVKSVTTCSSKHIHIKFKKSKSRYLKDNGGGASDHFFIAQNSKCTQFRHSYFSPNLFNFNGFSLGTYL
jgi:hypothetical protein